MYYMIIGRDRPGSAQARQEARPAHLARLETLVGENRLLLAGPLPRAPAPQGAPAEMWGSLIVAEFPSLEDAQAWATADPYSRAGVYLDVEVHPFRKVLP
jgi:uncharacterized protein YciI